MLEHTTLLLKKAEGIGAYGLYILTKKDSVSRREMFVTANHVSVTTAQFEGRSPWTTHTFETHEAVIGYVEASLERMRDESPHFEILAVSLVELTNGDLASLSVNQAPFSRWDGARRAREQHRSVLGV